MIYALTAHLGDGRLKNKGNPRKNQRLAESSPIGWKTGGGIVPRIK